MAATTSSAPIAKPAAVRWPAEWEAHAATWIAWPHNADDWPDKFEPIAWVYASIVGHLRKNEAVRILVDERSHLQAVSALRRNGIEADGQRVAFVGAGTDRVWTRDYAPFFLHDHQGGKLAVKWRFNAWAKYDNWQMDDAAGHAVADEVSVPKRTPVWQDRPIVLEGGSVDSNGRGTLLTTEECLLSEDQCRNPGLTRADYEAIFARELGISKVLWLGRGITGDDTHGHVDDLARFVAEDTVVVATENDRGDANFEPLRDNWLRLQTMTTATGQPLRVVGLPMPAPIHFDGQRLPASYANFYIANRAVLVPTFNDPHDRVALHILADLFPDRRIIGIHALDLVWGLGTLHCLTMQESA